MGHDSFWAAKQDIANIFQHAQRLAVLEHHSKWLVVAFEEEAEVVVPRREEVIAGREAALLPREEQLRRQKQVLNKGRVVRRPCGAAGRCTRRL